MPLKYVWGRAPFTMSAAAPLMPGEIRTEDAQAERLYAALNRHLNDPAAWAPALRLAAMLRRDPLQEPAAGLVADAMERQRPDGSLADDVMAAVAAASAAVTLYELNHDLNLLRRLMRWCAWFSENCVANMTVRALRENPADALWIFGRLYAITGKSGLTGLCAKLRSLALDWTTALRTYEFAHHAPDDPEIRHHAAALADGARASILNGMYSGNAQEKAAFRLGWEKLAHAHAAPGGGLTGDPVLAGTSPGAPLSVCAAGAWAEAFALQLQEGKSPWAEDALRRLLANRLCWAIDRADKLTQAELVRTARGYAAAFETAVMAQRDGGVTINRPMNGSFRLHLGDKPLTLTMTGDAADYSVTLDVEDVHGVLALHMPAWSGESTLTLSRGGSCSGHAGVKLMLSSDWRRGDVLRVQAGTVLHAEEGYHRSLCFLKGDRLLTAAADRGACWPAVAGEAAEDTVPLAGTEVPSGKDLPVYPAARGGAERVQLIPAGEEDCVCFPQAAR